LSEFDSPEKEEGLSQWGQIWTDSARLNLLRKDEDISTIYVSCKSAIIDYIDNQNDNDLLKYLVDGRKFMRLLLM
jgi:hypothetical protein